MFWSMTNWTWKYGSRSFLQLIWEFTFKSPKNASKKIAQPQKEKMYEELFPLKAASVPNLKLMSKVHKMTRNPIMFTIKKENIDKYI